MQLVDKKIIRVISEISGQTNMNNEVLIKAENVSKKFCRDFKRSLWYGMKDIGRSLLGQDHSEDELRKDEFWAVKDISFEVRRGECLGLIGHNGAGKSTLLKMLNGLINPDQGKITMRGRVGALIELQAGFNPVLTGRENVYNNGAVLGFTKKEIDAKFDSIVEFSEIGDFIDSPVQNYSSGMKVRLGFAVAAQMEPDILLIDEVLAVGDVGFRFKSLNAIGEIMKKSAVIFVSHAMPQIYRICTDVMLMDHGKKIYHSAKLGTGIDMYYNMFSSGEQQIAGSGEVKVLALEMNSGSERANLGETLPVKHGEDLNINIKLQVKEGIDDARMQLVIWNQELLPVMDVLDSEFLGQPIKRNAKNEANVSVTIPKIPLNAGKHTISVIVNASDLSRNYCRHDKAGIINISAHSPSGAHVLMPVEWNIS